MADSIDFKVYSAAFRVELGSPPVTLEELCELLEERREEGVISTYNITVPFVDREQPTDINDIFLSMEFFYLIRETGIPFQKAIEITTGILKEPSLLLPPQPTLFDDYKVTTGNNAVFREWEVTAHPKGIAERDQYTFRNFVGITSAHSLLAVPGEDGERVDYSADLLYSRLRGLTRLSQIPEILVRNARLAGKIGRREAWRIEYEANIVTENHPFLSVEQRIEQPDDAAVEKFLVQVTKELRASEAVYYAPAVSFWQGDYLLTSAFGSTPAMVVIPQQGFLVVPVNF